MTLFFFIYLLYWFLHVGYSKLDQLSLKACHARWSWNLCEFLVWNAWMFGFRVSNATELSSGLFQVFVSIKYSTMFWVFQCLIFVHFKERLWWIVLQESHQGSVMLILMLSGWKTRLINPCWEMKQLNNLKIVVQMGFALMKFFMMEGPTPKPKQFQTELWER